MKQLMILLLAALAFGQTGAKKSFTVQSSGIVWEAVTPPGAPPGLTQKVLHDHKDKQLVSAVIKFPKGYTEPRHYHTQCGHSIYVLKGKLKAPDGVWTAGSFNYAAVKEPHGPFTAIEETEILFYTDGPFDYHIAK
jgi:hypothetical protein